MASHRRCLKDFKCWTGIGSDTKIEVMVSRARSVHDMKVDLAEGLYALAPNGIYLAMTGFGLLSGVAKDDQSQQLVGVLQPLGQQQEKYYQETVEGIADHWHLKT